MDFEIILQAILLGVLEGLTEFIPVSSTGHLIVAADLLGFATPGGVFKIAIQLGAILAVCVKYWQLLSGVAFSLHTKSSSRKFARNIIIAFLPAAVIGLLAHSYIKEKLFSMEVVAVSLIVGGMLILLIERMAHKAKFRATEEISAPSALKIGFFQALAMIPGVSRSGATIMGGLLLGFDRKLAAEFSFFLAIPTMLGATVYDLYKNWAVLDADAFGLIAIGFVAAFFAALMVVSRLVDYVSNHGFKIFAYYRIVFGAFILLFLI